MKKNIILAMVVTIKVALVAVALVLAVNVQLEIAAENLTQKEAIYSQNQADWSAWKEKEEQRCFNNAVAYTYLGQDMTEIDQAKALIAEADWIEEARYSLDIETWTATYDADEIRTTHLYWLAGQKIVEWADRTGRYPIGFHGRSAALFQYINYDECGQKREEEMHPYINTKAVNFLHEVNRRFGCDICE